MDLYNALMTLVGKKVQIRAFTDVGVIISYVDITKVQDDLDLGRLFLFSNDSIVAMLKKNRPYKIIDADDVFEIHISNDISIKERG